MLCITLSVTVVHNTLERRSGTLSVIDRMEEHARTSGSGLSAVGEHLKANPDHTVDFQSPDILGASPYRSKLLIKEALYIQQYQPSLNEQVFSKKLFIFNV